MRNHNDGMWTAVRWEGFFYSLNGYRLSQNRQNHAATQQNR